MKILAGVKHTSFLHQRGYNCFETLDTLGIVISQGTGLSSTRKGYKCSLQNKTNVQTRTAISHRIKPKICSGQVFNFKLGHFVTWQSKCISRIENSVQVLSSQLKVIMLASVKHTSLLRRRGYKCFETLDTLGIIISQNQPTSAKKTWRSPFVQMTLCLTAYYPLYKAWRYHFVPIALFPTVYFPFS